MTLHDLHFATASGPVHISLRSGETLLVAGPNGVGKSAFLYALYKSLPADLGNYLPGHRQINFNNSWESLSQDLAQLRMNMHSSTNSFSRHKGAWSEDQFKGALRSLMNAEAAFNRKFRWDAENHVENISKIAKLKNSPVDTLNVIFASARLPVRFELTDQGFSARRDSSIYAIDALSDGERAALFLVATITTQAPNTVILIDEPEKHLHPSITGLLIEAALRARPDVSFVLASHDVYLIERLQVNYVLHVKNSTVLAPSNLAYANQFPEQRIYDTKLLSTTDITSDEIKIDLLGTRSKILFIEGDLNSPDVELYSKVYDDLKISPKGGYDKVLEAVKALGSLQDQHWLTAYGIIDGDGRSNSEKESLSRNNIFALDVPSIENLFFLDEAINCYVDARQSYFGGPSLQDRMATLGQAILRAANDSGEDIIALRASWQINRQLNEMKISPKMIKQGKTTFQAIDPTSIISSLKQSYESVISSQDWRTILEIIPIKGTKIPNAAAMALGARSFDEYKSAIFRQMEIKTPLADSFKQALKRRLPSF